MRLTKVIYEYDSEEEMKEHIKKMTMERFILMEYRCSPSEYSNNGFAWIVEYVWHPGLMQNVNRNTL